MERIKPCFSNYKIIMVTYFQYIPTHHDYIFDIFNRIRRTEFGNETNMNVKILEPQQNTYRRVFMLNHLLKILEPILNCLFG